MTALSERLSVIASQTGSGETMADIGTDHGFLPLFLVSSGKCPFAVVADVSEGSLAKARQNIALAGFAADDPRFSLRLGDGLSVIERGEVDNVVIAGMGGALIRDIILEDVYKSYTVKRFILQPRKAPGRLRHGLLEAGFSIDRELLAREGRFICEILVVSPPDDTRFGAPYDGPGPDSIELEAPESVFDLNGDLAAEFFRRKLEKYRGIRDNILNAGSDDWQTRVVAEYNIAYLEDALARRA